MTSQEFENNQEKKLTFENEDLNDFHVKTFDELESLQKKFMERPNLSVNVCGSKKESEDINIWLYEQESYQNIEFECDKKKLQNGGYQWVEKFQKLSCLKLSLKDLDLKIEDIEDLAKLFSKFQTLENLSLEFVLNDLSGEIGKFLFEKISELSHLKSLQIDFGAANLGNEGVIELGKVLQKFSNLQNLVLLMYNNKITNQGACELGISLSQCLNLRNLNLDLSTNQIENGQEDLAHGISLCPKLAELFIMIYGNDFENSYNLEKILFKSKSLVKFSICDQF